MSDISNFEMGNEEAQTSEIPAPHQVSQFDASGITNEVNQGSNLCRHVLSVLSLNVEPIIINRNLILCIKCRVYE